MGQAVGKKMYVTQKRDWIASSKVPNYSKS